MGMSPAVNRRHMADPKHRFDAVIVAIGPGVPAYPAASIVVSWKP